MLSNLTVRSNLLASETYQCDLFHCSAVELLDIQDRYPILIAELPTKKRAELAELNARRGRTLSKLPDDWAGPIFNKLEVADLSQSGLSEEQIFEALAIARQAYHARRSGPLRDRVAEFDRAALAQLLRAEPRLTPEAIEARLALILGGEFRAPPDPVVPPTVVAEVQAAPVSPPPPPVAAVGLGANSNANWAPARNRKLLTKALAPPVKKPIKKPVVKKATPRPAAPKPAPERVVEIAPPPAIPIAAPALQPAIDPDFARVAARWAGLPAHVRQCILMLIDAAPIAAGAEPCPSTPPLFRATSPPASAAT